MNKYEMNKELTKAKELLTKWVELFKPKGNTSISPTPIQVETEQFLSRGKKMKKQLIRTSRTKDLFMIYDDKHCFYVVSVGKIKVNKNGEITSKNVLYSSKHMQDCLNYFENEGTK